MCPLELIMAAITETLQPLAVAVSGPYSKTSTGCRDAVWTRYEPCTGPRGPLPCRLVWFRVGYESNQWALVYPSESKDCYSVRITHRLGDPGEPDFLQKLVELVRKIYAEYPI